MKGERSESRDFSQLTKILPSSIATLRRHADFFDSGKEKSIFLGFDYLDNV